MMENLLDNLCLLASSDGGFITGLVTQAWTLFKVAIGIGVVIFVHELGHFAAAKTFGVKCEKFYVGFDIPMPSIGPIQLPSTLGKFRWGETEYGIGILPLGGYVKMLGQDDDPRALREQLEAKNDSDSEDDEDLDGNESAPDSVNASSDSGDPDDAPKTVTPLDPRSYQAQPVWQRMIIISAGVVMNLITGVLFAAVAYGFGVSYTPSRIGTVSPGGPAWEAGVQPGGRVVAVGRQTDPLMSFRDMRHEILSRGLGDPENPIPVTVQYGDEARKFDLRLMNNPDMPDMRMIGIGITISRDLGLSKPFDSNTPADGILTEQMAGMRVKAVNGITVPIKPQENDEGASESMAGTWVATKIFSDPTRPVKLDLVPVPRINDDGTVKESDDSDRLTEPVSVTIPPRKARTLGFDFQVGPIKSLIQGGPAESQGLKVGDQIVSVDGEPVPGAYQLAVQLLDAKSAIKLKVERNRNGQQETVECLLEPSDMPQTGKPDSDLTQVIGINAFGFAFEPLSLVQVENEADTDTILFQSGDKIEKVVLNSSLKNMPESYQEDLEDTSGLERLQKGWTIEPGFSVVRLDQVLQNFPIGTKFEVTVSRGKDKKITSVQTALNESETEFRFDRGIVFQSPEELRQASSAGEAMQLGFAQAKSRFVEVVDFLKMAATGRLKLRYVGGPLLIFQVAKAEAELGISRQLMFLTLLSMNLAILNFLPIPALDGGHMMFLGYELVTRKRPNEAWEYRLTLVGFLFLLSLMIVVFTQDIWRLIS